MKLVRPRIMPIKVAAAMPKEARIMGRRRDSSICCRAPKPTVKAPPAAISAPPGWPSQIPRVRQIAIGRTKMRSARKDCAFQSKTKLSVRKGAWDAGDGADISEAALSEQAAEKMLFPTAYRGRRAAERRHP